MRNIILFVFVILVFPTGNVAAQDDHVALVKNVTGEVLVHRLQKSLPASPGMQLQKDDKIISKTNATVGLIFTDGTLLSIGPSSEIDINQYVFEPKNELYDFSLYMKKGTALYSTGKLGKLSPESVKLKTPRAMVGVRGTRFIVKVD